MKKITVDRNFSRFSSRQYLSEYYTEVGKENRKILNFLHRVYAKIFKSLNRAEVLEFGGGPTIYQLISLAQYSVTIHFTDFLPSNLHQIRLWLENHPQKFDWTGFFKYALPLEKHHSSVDSRQNQLRHKIAALFHCNAKTRYPLGKSRHRQYDIVSTHFVTESITFYRSSWRNSFSRIVSLVKPGGYLVGSAICGASHYQVGSLRFPAVPITPENILDFLKDNSYLLVDKDWVDAEHPDQGYQGLFMFTARRLT